MKDLRVGYGKGEMLPQPHLKLLQPQGQSQQVKNSLSMGRWRGSEHMISKEIWPHTPAALEFLKEQVTKPH